MYNFMLVIKGEIYDCVTWDSGVILNEIWNQISSADVTSK